MQNIHTNSNLQETTKHGGPDFPLEFYIDDTRKFYNNDINWHWHKEFEIICVSEGTVTCQVEQKTYTLHSGEGIFINSGMLSQLKTMASCLILYFPPLFLLQVKVLFTKNIFCH